MPIAPFHLETPVRRDTSVVFASPHSGRIYQRSFLNTSMLDEHTIRSSEDAFVDQLFADAPRYGAPLLSATLPRAYLDLNRGPDELDPALIRGVARGRTNPRVLSGLGVIPRVVANGRTIYRGKITMSEADSRLNAVWRPYHGQLNAVLEQSRDLFGEAILIDCHSMPHDAIETLSRNRSYVPEIVLGDRFGASADGDIVDRIEDAFLRAGFRVARNRPFAGAYITSHYGAPVLRRHAVQIEIDRALYMNEVRIRPNANFDSLKRTITGIVAEICDIGRNRAQLAAE